MPLRPGKDAAMPSPMLSADRLAWPTALLPGLRLLWTRTLFPGRADGDTRPRLLSLAPGLMSIGRLLILDGLLTLCTTVALLTAFEFLRTGGRAWWLLAAVACGLGVLTKGPVALILLIPPLLAYCWLCRSGTQYSV